MPLADALGDRDGDGIADDKDKCPDKPETRNGYQDDDGCPEGNIDRDGDGLRDKAEFARINAERDEQGRLFRWTSGPHAAFFLPGPSRSVEIRVIVAHPDAHDRPVAVRISGPAGILVNQVRSDAATLVARVTLPARGGTFQVDVSRTWRPLDFGSSDDRTLGARVEVHDWR